MTWVRTMRRAPGSDPDALGAERIHGPWHEERDHGLTWCGRRAGRLVASDRRGTEPPAEERRCLECAGAKAAGRPLPYRRGR